MVRCYEQRSSRALLGTRQCCTTDYPRHARNYLLAYVYSGGQISPFSIALTYAVVLNTLARLRKCVITLVMHATTY